MDWFPIGPDFTFSPRNESFLRLSRQNEFCSQGAVHDIAVRGDSLYVIVRPPFHNWPTSAFRSDDRGDSWRCISDSFDNLRLSFDCIAVDPADGDHILIGASGDAGHAVLEVKAGMPWSPNPVTGRFFRILFDPRNPQHVYAASSDGVQVSEDGGTIWNNTVWVTGTGSTVDRFISSLVARIPPAGTADFFACVPNFHASVPDGGIYHTNDPIGGPWTRIFHDVRLPDGTPAKYLRASADFAPNNPKRMYARFTRDDGKTLALYTTSDPFDPAKWQRVYPAVVADANDGDGPLMNDRSISFAVSPNSPGDGANDVVFMGHVFVSRSADGAKTWRWNTRNIAAMDFRDPLCFGCEEHRFVFLPGIGTDVAVMYAGNDGGLARSRRFADPAVVLVNEPPGDFRHPANGIYKYNEDAELHPESVVFENCNHGMQSSAVAGYASDPSIGALGYIACQDTAVAGGAASLAGWRELKGSDAYTVAARAGSDGVHLWFNRMGLWVFAATDREQLGDIGGADVKFEGLALWSSGNYVVVDDFCLVPCWTGGWGRLDAGVAAGPATVKLVAEFGNSPGVLASLFAEAQAAGTLVVDYGDARELIAVTASNAAASTITATFTKSHSKGAQVRFYKTMFVGGISGSGQATRLSQDFVGSGQHPALVAAGAANLFCVTAEDGKPDIEAWFNPAEVPPAGNWRLWTTTQSAIATPPAQWAEISAGKPFGDIAVTSLTVAADGALYVLLAGIPPGTATPLYRVALVSGVWTWQAQTLTSGADASIAGADGNALRFRRIVAHPLEADRLFLAFGGSVFTLTRSGGAWTTSKTAAGLPQCGVHDLWIGNIGTAQKPRVLLRAAVPTRGMWECDVTAGALPENALYLRDNVLDAGWLATSPKNVPNPYHPEHKVRHFHCADIKIDARNVAGGAQPFYQTDASPLPHVLFEQLNDNSQNLVESGAARVHVQVHYRNTVPSGDVSVWAIYCRAAAGVPGLDKLAGTTDTFDFWSLFLPDGTVNAGALPEESPWTSVGLPVVRSGIHAAEPKVASWDWTVPDLSEEDSGHYCIVAFLHGTGHLLPNTLGFDVDAMTPKSPQIGQKNLHILNTGASPLSSFDEVVEFHNPGAQPRTATLEIDLGGLPAGVKTRFALTPLETRAPLAQSISGVAASRRTNALLALWRRLVCLLLPRRCRRRRRGFGRTIYEASPSALVRIDGVRLPPRGSCAVNLMLDVPSLQPGTEHPLEVRQIVNGEVAGGSTYVVRVAGDRRSFRPVAPPGVHDALSSRA